MLAIPITAKIKKNKKSPKNPPNQTNASIMARNPIKNIFALVISSIVE